MIKGICQFHLWFVVSHGQTLVSHRGIIAFSISAPHERGFGRVHSAHSVQGQQILLGVNSLHVMLSASTLTWTFAWPSRCGLCGLSIYISASGKVVNWSSVQPSYLLSSKKMETWSKRLQRFSFNSFKTMHQTTSSTATFRLPAL